MQKVSAAAASVTRLATVATPVRCTAWARKGPAVAPAYVVGHVGRPAGQRLLGGQEQLRGLDLYGAGDQDEVDAMR